MNISIKLVYKYMALLAIFFTFSPTSSHLYQLQVKNSDSNSRLVVDEDDNGKFRLVRVNSTHLCSDVAGINEAVVTLTKKLSQVILLSHSSL